jgi:hypothetical protein
MIKTKRKYFVTGATAIGDELGCSAITVRRMIAANRLRAFRTGDNSSPWKVWLDEIERVRRGGLTQHIAAAE